MGRESFDADRSYNANSNFSQFYELNERDLSLEHLKIFKTTLFTKFNIFFFWGINFIIFPECIVVLITELPHFYCYRRICPCKLH